jgi:hypothetical protein
MKKNSYKDSGSCGLTETAKGPAGTQLAKADPKMRLAKPTKAHITRP